MSRFGLPIAFLLPTMFSTGCIWTEDLDITNMTGTVVIPRAAATRDFLEEDGTITTRTDVRLIGPVYLGLYPELTPAGSVERYPHPAVGPQFTPGLIGDTYPYGGTNIGSFRSACLEEMQCRVVSGRFVDFDGMVDWFNNVIGAPIVDQNGDDVTSGEFVRQTCFSVFEYTSDEEIRLTVTEDRNNDGVMDAGDLDFVERSDGNFEANFILWQQEFFSDEESGQGMSLWGYMNGPGATDAKFNSCNSDSGVRVVEYSQDYQVGGVQLDLLNRPSKYISRGDWVSGTQDATGDVGFIYTDAGDTPELWLNFEVQ